MKYHKFEFLGHRISTEGQNEYYAAGAVIIRLDAITAIQTYNMNSKYRLVVVVGCNPFLIEEETAERILAVLEKPTETEY